MNGRAWTNKEIDYMLSNTHLPARKIAEKLRRTEEAVRHKRWELNGDYDVAMAPTPERLTQDEKLSRIYVLASKLGVRIEEGVQNGK